jgi:hypothetical protein
LGLDAFAGILKASDISLIVDIRIVPRSHANPQFNIDAVAGGLMSWGIGYNIFRNSEVGAGAAGLSPIISSPPATRSITSLERTSKRPY